jgi:hypothetical protein
MFLPFVDLNLLFEANMILIKLENRLKFSHTIFDKCIFAYFKNIKLANKLEELFFINFLSAIFEINLILY